jgi:hypothetical protein
MIFMEEVSVETKTVEFIIWVSIIEFPEELQFFQTSLVPEKIPNEQQITGCTLGRLILFSLSTHLHCISLC